MKTFTTKFQPTSTHPFVVALLAALGLAQAVTATPTTRYVDFNNTAPAPPFTNWTAAATSIQDAVDVAFDGDLILVTNGVYETGGRVVYGAMTNRVAVTKPVTVASVNGPEVTIIRGYQVPGTTNGDAAIRCVYLTNGAVLSGFTLTNGATRAAGNPSQEQSGGAVRCDAATVIVSNCVLAGNLAIQGGGASWGMLDHCTLIGNSARDGGGVAWSTLNHCALNGNSARWGGGAVWGTLSNCTLTRNSAYHGGGALESTLDSCTLSTNTATRGGGTTTSTLNNCTLTGNSAGEGGGAYNSRVMNNCTLIGNSAGTGGGVFGGPLNNCILTSNWATGSGGGAFSAMVGICTMNNCTVTGNSAGSWGGGTYSCRLNNCIVYYNTATNEPNMFSGVDGGPPNYCCTTPMPINGVRNITSAPGFIDLASGNLRLQSNSACINTGNNSYVANSTDLDGRPRIIGGTVDIGAYEYQGPGLGEFTAWLQQYRLPTDGSADYLDADGDGRDNWQEWRSWTDPTNALSVLRLVSAWPDGTNVTATWESVAGVSYFLERSTNLWAVPPFVTVVTNVAGHSGTTTHIDTNASGPGPLFYRVGVGN